MRDLAEKWSVAADWQSAVITAPGLLVRAISGLVPWEGSMRFEGE